MKKFTMQFISMEDLDHSFYAHTFDLSLSENEIRVATTFVIYCMVDVHNN